VGSYRYCNSEDHGTKYAYSVLAVIVDRATVGQISEDEQMCAWNINI